MKPRSFNDVQKLPGMGTCIPLNAALGLAGEAGPGARRRPPDDAPEIAAPQRRAGYRKRGRPRRSLVPREDLRQAVACAKRVPPAGFRVLKGAPTVTRTPRTRQAGNSASSAR